MPVEMHHQNSRYVIYFKEECGFCTKARGKLKTIMKTESGNVHEILITPKIQETLKVKYGQSTVPYIFCDNEFVGGAAELDRWFQARIY